MIQSKINNYGKKEFRSNLNFYLCVLFILIPFGQSIPVFTIGGRVVNIGMSTLLIAFILMLVLISPKKWRISSNEPVTKWIILLSGWSLITVILSLRLAPAFTLANSFITWIRWFQFIPIMLIIIWGTGKEKDFRLILRILKILALIIAIWAIYQSIYPSEFSQLYFRGAVTFTKPLFREHELIEVIDPDTGYYIGSANYNIAGTYSAMSGLMLLPFLLHEKKAGKYNLITITIIGILFLGIVSSQSRSALISFFVGILVIYFKPSIIRVFSTLIFTSIAIILFSIFLSSTNFGLMITETLFKLPEAIPIVMDGQEYSNSLEFSINVYGAAKRFFTMREAFIVFLNFPLLGCGFFGFSYQAPELGTAESFYLQLLAETGIIGFGMLIMFLVKLWSYTKTEFHKGSFSYLYQIGFRGAFSAAIFANLTGTLFYDQRIWGLFLMLGAIQVKNVYSERTGQKNIAY